MRRALAGALFAALSSSASAADWSVIVSTVSLHAQREAEFCERPAAAKVGPPTDEEPECRARLLEQVNPGLGIGRKIGPRVELLAGAYRNSYGHSSRYAVASVEIVEHWSVAAGYLDGYERPPLALALVSAWGPVRVVVTPRPAVVSLWFALPL